MPELGLCCCKPFGCAVSGVYESEAVGPRAYSQHNLFWPISKLHQYPNANKRPEGGEWIVTHTRLVGLNSGQYRMWGSEFYETIRRGVAIPMRRGRMGPVAQRFRLPDDESDRPAVTAQ
jgi:hypothetical protein